MDIIDSQKGVSFGQNMQVRLQRSEEITESGTMTEKGRGQAQQVVQKR
jgi:hypothetical protein